MEERHCPQCDSLYGADAKFCSSCGATITASAPTAEQTLPTSMVSAPTIPIPQSNPVAPLQPQNIAPITYKQHITQEPPQQPVQQNPYQQQVPQYPYQQQVPQYPYAQAPIQQVNVVMTNSAPPVMIVNQKSVGLALLLTFLFGPLGMFYSTVSGAVIMLIVSVVLAFITLGISAFITWPI